MKLALALLVAGAAAVAPPRIELDLVGRQDAGKIDTTRYSNLPFFRQSGNVERNSHGNSIPELRQDYVQRCTVQESTFVTCPFPVARAYDHTEGDISDSLKITYYSADVDNTPCDVSTDANKCVLATQTGTVTKDTALPAALTNIFKTRQTILVKYDVSDSAGNHAEQVVFLLEIDDRCADCGPVISVCGSTEAGTDEVWEAAGDRKMCDGASGSTTANDPVASVNADGDKDNNLDAKIVYDIHQVSTNADNEVVKGTKLCDGETYNADSSQNDCANEKLTTFINEKREEEFLITFRVCDNAGLYGKNEEDNCASADKYVKIIDRTQPIITIQGWGDADHPTAGAMKWECHYDPANTVAAWSNVDGHEMPREVDGKVYHDQGHYTDRGASVSDTLDNYFESRLPMSYTTTEDPTVDVTSRGTYHVHYNAQDMAENPAVEKTRVVNVVDTNAPRVTLEGYEFVKDERVCTAGDEKCISGASTGDHPDYTEHEAEEANPLWTEPAWSCDDDCDRTGNGMKQEPVWDGAVWNDRVVGDYFRLYKCMDASGNFQTARRKFTVVDRTKPIIVVMGQTSEVLEATNAEEYTDNGATCEDYVDGPLSHAVEVSGQVVNMRRPGNYTIQYDCQDLSGNKAVPMHRIVTVVDTTCPEIKMTGKSPMYIEAGFPYVDEGATASDTLDGNLTLMVEKDGDTVNVANAFHSARSCREILETGTKELDGNNKLSSGMYYITTYHTGAYHRTLVHCDMDTKDDDGNAVGYTYKSCGSLQTPCDSVVPYGDAAGSCAQYGLEMVDWSGRQASCEWAKTKHSGDFPPEGFDCADSDTWGPDSVVNYLCGTNDEMANEAARPEYYRGAHKNNWQMDHLFKKNQQLVSEAEAGVYVIYYHVKDAAENPECDTPSRTVIVKDTLPPVISLHRTTGWDHKDDSTTTFIHASKGDQRGLGGELNPAGDHEESLNPNLLTAEEHAVWSAEGNEFPRTGTTADATLMAEQSASSVNGWVLGALASAVTGLALLGYSARQAQAAATHVEV